MESKSKIEIIGDPYIKPTDEDVAFYDALTEFLKTEIDNFDDYRSFLTEDHGIAYLQVTATDKDDNEFDYKVFDNIYEAYKYYFRYLLHNYDDFYYSEYMAKRDIPQNIDAEVSNKLSKYKIIDKAETIKVNDNYFCVVRDPF